ncbi:hypothetical protein DQ04_01631010 [Trypanosoma grayi]|uniref:hypothetical protein n=1 Tax=Trypanosoma grayi TaxID=71804 RepID=UPI0004F43DBC|nr:hypothetical protein DQ04_01631010 [Trypanosoma grayi]KEG12535.1 hypothetical protein DQ04_01631010 [Trypanosoma grayi]
MPVPLGASLNDPHFVLVQIIHVVSAFFLFLGMARVVLGLLALVFSDNSTLPLAVVLSRCFHVPLRSLFAVRVTDVTDGSARRFFFMHVLAALGLSYPLALTIQRRKFALDFAFTLYAVYFVLCCVVERRLWGGGFAWWVTVLAGFGILYSTTTLLCKRRELQDIFFSPVATTVTPSNNSNNSNSNNNNNSGGGEAMTMLSAAVETVTVDVDGRLFTNGCSSPSHGMEAVLMGPGSASKRRR